MATEGEIIDRAVQLVHTFVPGENLSGATGPAIGCLLAGAILIFSGARVIRGLVVLSCSAAGGYVGWLAAQRLTQPSAVGILAGAAFFGVLGLLLSRLWIAGLSGVLAAVVALTIYGVHQDIPKRFEQFARTSRQPAPTAHNEFPLGEPGSATANASQTPWQVAQRFVTDLRRHNDPLSRNAVLWGGGAFLVGTLVGLLAARWAMIFWTSLAGLTLMVGGLVIVLSGPWPGWNQVAEKNASLVLGAIGTLWLTGMLVQWRSTRTVGAALRGPAEAVVHLSTSPR
jgi:hypothetical protein